MRLWTSLLQATFLSMILLTPLTQAAAEEAKPAPALTPAQQQALDQFGRSLAQAMTDKDGAAVQAHLDTDEFVSRLFQNMPDLEAKAREPFMKKFNQRPGGWMGGNMTGNAVFLRTRERQGLLAVQLRLRTEAGSLDYADALVRPDGAGFKVVDLYDYAIASMLSEEIRSGIALGTPAPGEETLAKMLGIPLTHANMRAHIKALVMALRTNDDAEVITLWEAFPAELKKVRMVFVGRLKALERLSRQGSPKVAQDYEAALRQAPEILGKDSTTELWLMYLLLRRQDFQGAEECLKRTETAVGGDPYLKLMRANLRAKMKDLAGALALADTVEMEDPALGEDLADVRLAVHLERKDYAALVRELRVYQQKFDVIIDPQALAKEEVYADFVKSPEFAAWQKELAQ